MSMCFGVVSSVSACDRTRLVHILCVQGSTFNMFKLNRLFKSERFCGYYIRLQCANAQ